jgi:hypothetical protein
VSENHRPANEGRRRLTAIDGGGSGELVRLAQRGDRVEILTGRHAGRTGHVVGVAIVRCLAWVRRYPVILLDGPGRRWPHHFDDADLRIID